MSRLMVATLLTLAAVPAMAGPIDSGLTACFELTWGTGSARACTPIDPDKGSFSYRAEEPFGDDSDDGFIVESLSFNGNADPFLAYAIGVTDFGAPSLFGFLFGTPIVVDAYTHARASIATALVGNDGTSVAINPVAPATRMQVSSAGNPALASLGIDVGPACSGSGIVACPPDTAETFFAPTIYSFMTVGTTFQMSGGGDQAALSGSLVLDKETTVVPEPGTLLLMGAGLVGLLRRR